MLTKFMDKMGYWSVLVVFLVIGGFIFAWHHWVTSLSLTDHLFPAIPMLRKIKKWDYENKTYYCDKTVCGVQLTGKWTFDPDEDYLPKMQGTLKNHNVFTVSIQHWRKFISGKKGPIDVPFRIAPQGEELIEVWRYDTFPICEILPGLGGQGGLAVLKPNHKR